MWISFSTTFSRCSDLKKICWLWRLSIYLSIVCLFQGVVHSDILLCIFGSNELLCELMLLSYLFESVRTIFTHRTSNDWICENPSRSQVSEILRPAHLAPTTMLHLKSIKSLFFHILVFFSSLSTCLDALNFFHVIGSLDAVEQAYITSECKWQFNWYKTIKIMFSQVINIGIVLIS